MDLATYTVPLRVTHMHMQTAPHDVPKRLPFGTGHMEVLNVQRLKEASITEVITPINVFVHDWLIVDGLPSSRNSTVNRAVIGFVGPSVDPPLTTFEEATRSLQVYLKYEDRQMVRDLLRKGKQRMMYAWFSADRTRSVVMLMAMG